MATNEIVGNSGGGYFTDEVNKVKQEVEQLEMEKMKCIKKKDKVEEFVMCDI